MLCSPAAFSVTVKLQLRMKPVDVGLLQTHPAIRLSFDVPVRVLAGAVGVLSRLFRFLLPGLLLWILIALLISLPLWLLVGPSLSWLLLRPFILDGRIRPLLGPIFLMLFCSIFIFLGVVVLRLGVFLQLEVLNDIQFGLLNLEVALSREPIDLLGGRRRSLAVLSLSFLFLR